MRTFLIIWGGQTISLLGSIMTSFSLGVWIFEETGRATPFALTVLFANLPSILLAPLGGSLADRWNRRMIMILADTGSALTTVAVMVLLSTGGLQIWHIYVIASINSILATFQNPAFSSSVTMLVPKKDLGRASGIINTGDSIGTLLSPVLAGVLFVSIGFRGILLIDFITFFFAIGTLLFVRIPQPEVVEFEGKQKGKLWKDVAFGWRYLKARPGLFGLLWFFALVNFMLSLSNVLRGPLMLSFTDADKMGLAQAIGGVGMLIGSLIMSAWGGPKKRVYGVIGFIALMGLGQLITGLQPSVALIGAGTFVMLFSLPFAGGSSQAIFQTKVAPGIQGRVFAIRGMIARSAVPLANLISGPLADNIFEPLLLKDGPLANTLVGALVGVGAGRGMGLIFILSGAFMVAASALVFLNPRVRNVETELPDALPDGEEAGEPEGDAVSEPVHA
jgi:MFS family permease